jgi:hypothetical protein
MDSDDLKSKSLVVLNRIRSGITLLNIVRDSYQGSITCDADPTPQNVDAMTAVVGKLEEIMQQPWARPGDQLELSLSERLRAAVTIGEHLKHLESEAVGFFAGTYTARTQVPRYDNEEGEMYITGRTPFELVTMFRVVIAPAGSGDRLTVKANDIYVPPKAPAFESGDDLQAQADKLDEDIPF